MASLALSAFFDFPTVFVAISETVWLARGRGAECRDDSAVGVIGDALLDGSARAVDDGPIITQIVLRVVMERDGGPVYCGVASGEEVNVELSVTVDDVAHVY